MTPFEQTQSIREAIEMSPDAMKALNASKAAMAGYLKDHSHVPPYDCYATGPRTGDEFYDLVRCPGCCAQEAMTAAIAQIDAALSLARGE